MIWEMERKTVLDVHSIQFPDQNSEKKKIYFFQPGIEGWEGIYKQIHIRFTKQYFPAFYEFLRNLTVYHAFLLNSIIRLHLDGNPKEFLLVNLHIFQNLIYSVTEYFETA